MTPIHHAIRRHIADRLHHATKPKFVVTAGISLAALLEAVGSHSLAFAVSILTNIVWIWE